MLNILVTGAAGYIGSVLCRQLLDLNSQGYQYRVIGVDNFYFNNQQSILPCLSDPNFQFYKYNVSHVDRMESLYRQADVIIPLAAYVGAPLCDKINTEEVYSLNTGVISYMVHNLSRHQLVIYPNTNSGYGQTDGDTEVTEEDPLNPISDYGISKCRAEEYVLDHENSVVFRLATVFGISPRPRFDLMVNDFTYRLQRVKKSRSNSFAIYEPHFKRNFIHVQDVARAFIFAIQRRDMHGVFNLGHPQANLTKLELAEKICQTIGLDTSLIQTMQGEDKDKRNYLVSNKKILERGFGFTKFIHEGIAEMNLLSGLLTDEQVEKMKNV